MRSTTGGNIRVVMPAQDVWSAFQSVVTDPPTSLCMEIGLADSGVDTDAHCTDECGLADVRSKSRPEVVVDIRPAMKCPGVQCKPMPHDVEERNEERDSNNEDEGETKSNPAPVAVANNFG